MKHTINFLEISRCDGILNTFCLSNAKYNKDGGQENFCAITSPCDEIEIGFLDGAMSFVKGLAHCSEQEDEDYAIGPSKPPIVHYLRISFSKGSYLLKNILHSEDRVRITTFSFETMLKGIMVVFKDGEIEECLVGNDMCDM